MLVFEIIGIATVAIFAILMVATVLWPEDW